MISSSHYRYFLAALLPGALCAQAGEKKVIYHGWNTPDSGYVAAHWQEMERMPFDGIGIGIPLDRSKPTTGNGSTANLLGWQIFGRTAFKLDDFQQAISDLKKPAWTKFTDNFLPLAIATRDQDQGLSWFNDKRWATIEGNWRVLLTIARAGGCRGVLLDPEHYDYECELFHFLEHRAQRADRPFAEYEAQARARGRQLGAASAEVFPDLVIGLFYGYTLPWRELEKRELETTRYALLPAFLDGLLEASGPKAKFVDLWEYGHGCSTREQFLAGREAIQAGALPLVANPEIYRAKVSPGMSLRVDRGLAESTLRAALEASDRYVWIYAEENPRFFPPANVAPEILQTLRARPREL